MLILLPPSEGKTAPIDGAPLDLASLFAPELNPVRREVINALIQASAGGPEAIGAPPSTSDEVEGNTRIWQRPSARASEVYTGVLFAAARFAELDDGAARRAREHVRIASTVFGFLAPDDHIPPYRLPPAGRLPGIGAPVAHLARATRAVMNTYRPALVLDCRSTPYLPLWRPTCPWVHVRAVEMRSGRRVVVSHFAKLHRGVLTHHLLTRTGPMPASVDEVADAARELLGSHYAEVTVAPGKPGTHVLELTVLPGG